MTRLKVLEEDLETLRTVRMEIFSSGYASATLSSTGGSQSYTRLDADKIRSAIGEIEDEMYQLRQ